MINQEQLQQQYKDKLANYFLLDVRSPMEFLDHHLPGSVNIAIDTLENHLSEIPKNLQIITICEHGVRSGKCETFLKEKGFNVQSLEGGLSVWKGILEL